MFWLGIELAFGLVAGFFLLALVIGIIGGFSAIVGAFWSPANASPDRSSDQSRPANV